MAHVQGRSVRKLHPIHSRPNSQSTHTRKQHRSTSHWLHISATDRTGLLTTNKAASFRHSAQDERAALSFPLDSYIRVCPNSQVEVYQTRSPAKIYLNCGATRLNFWLCPPCLVVVQAMGIAHVQGQAGMNAKAQQVLAEVAR